MVEIKNLKIERVSDKFDGGVFGNEQWWNGTKLSAEVVKSCLVSDVVDLELNEKGKIIYLKKKSDFIDEAVEMTKKTINDVSKAMFDSEQLEKSFVKSKEQLNPMFEGMIFNKTVDYLLTKNAVFSDKVFAETYKMLKRLAVENREK